MQEFAWERMMFRPGVIEFNGEYHPETFAKMFYKQSTIERVRTLIFCPTAGLDARTINGILAQKDSGYTDVVFTRDNPYDADGGEVFRNIQLNYEKMRRIALDYKYDRVWIVESDMIIPDDALARLSEVDADVVSGVYILPTKPTRLNLVNPKGDSGVVECGGGSMGCLLIKTKVLEDFSFILDDPFPPDVALMEYCRKQRFKQMGHWGVVCGHIGKDGKVLWPSKSTEVFETAYRMGMIQVEEEIKSLYEFLKERSVENILEIGTAGGGTAYLWSQLASGVKVSVDLLNMPNFDGVQFVKGDSHDETTKQKVKEILGDKQLDLLFIDGDHSYEGVKQDYEMYRDLVRPGGIIAFHDINDSRNHRLQGCMVSQLWQEIEGNKQEFNSHEDRAGIGVIQTEEQ